MSEQVTEDAEAADAASAPNGELVHWMESGPLRVGPAGMSLAAIGGFALGVGATLAVLALSDWLSPERVVEVPARGRRA